MGERYSGSINGTSLVEVFGIPNTMDGHKSRVQWFIKFDDGRIAAIYNDKDISIPLNRLMEWVKKFDGGRIAAIYDYRDRSIPVNRLMECSIGGYEKSFWPAERLFTEI